MYKKITAAFLLMSAVLFSQEYKQINEQQLKKDIEALKNLSSEKQHEELEKLLKDIVKLEYKSWRSLIFSLLEQPKLLSQQQKDRLLEKTKVYNDKELAEILLKNRADPNSGSGLLGAKTIDFVELYLHYGARLDSKSWYNTTLLHGSMDPLVDPEVTAFYLTKKIDVNSITVNGDTPAHLLAELCYMYNKESKMQAALIKKVELLRDAGADFSQKNYDDKNPIELASDKKSQDDQLCSCKLFVEFIEKTKEK